VDPTPEILVTQTMMIAIPIDNLPLVSAPPVGVLAPEIPWELSHVFTLTIPDKIRPSGRVFAIQTFSRKIPKDLVDKAGISPESEML
jgi:hypothetical protein